MFSALHTLETTPRVVASLYRSSTGVFRSTVHAGERNRVTETATIEPRLDQLGQGNSIIKIALRAATTRRTNKQVYDGNRLRLTPADATDLITALQYLVGVAKHRVEATA